LASLSNPGLKKAWADRPSSLRVCGFGLHDGTADETTPCRFRGALAKQGSAAALSSELTARPTPLARNPTEPINGACFAACI
jgi:IS5 family transposase